MKDDRWEIIWVDGDAIFVLKRRPWPVPIKLPIPEEPAPVDAAA